MSAVRIRALSAADYATVSAVVDAWWGGRVVRQLLPRLFFEHFSDTSFALEHGAELQGFLIGFRSQSVPALAYIHFVGVAPASRGNGGGRLLYQRFFERAAALGCSAVQCITAPVNTGSIAFHRRMGFDLVDTGAYRDGVPVSLDHAGPGEHRVLFRKTLVAGT